MKEQDLIDAKAERTQRIKLLRACNCDWPIVTRRNGSGHSDDCPAHKLHEQRQTTRGTR